MVPTDLLHPGNRILLRNAVLIQQYKNSKVKFIPKVYSFRSEIAIKSEVIANKTEKNRSY
jgi:hypothetical protein